ncbi:putative outer membrane protein [Campylobacter devanensis]|uniref:Outer membrane beta-barrel domain protein n=1 Tax=Campylobacter devanensis TaxID=3161138 RepID=A0A1X9SRH0_9BACT|nr:outer membrane beta-barrel protein [Campylobacter lanienae]ARQ98825.1 outer membrane beta-barrel domain protein [Campylobacter lanienae]SUX01891.1 putative outer membrane protein [Campylobacter lanienae]
MTNIVKFGAVVVAATAILSSSAAAQGVFVGVEGALLQSQVKLDDIYPSVLDDPKDTSIELGLKGGYDFDAFRVWGGYSYRTKGSEDYNMKDGADFINGEFNWQTHNILVGADYTPSLTDSFKLALGAYTGLSIVKGEFSGQAEYTTDGLTYVMDNDSTTGTGAIFGLKLGGIYEVVENNEIEFGIKGDYQTTGIEDYDNILNYGVYVGYNYKF